MDLLIQVGIYTIAELRRLNRARKFKKVNSIGDILLCDGRNVILVILTWAPGSSSRDFHLKSQLHRTSSCGTKSSMPSHPNNCDSITRLAPTSLLLMVLTSGLPTLIAHNWTNWMTGSHTRSSLERQSEEQHDLVPSISTRLHKRAHVTQQLWAVALIEPLVKCKTELKK